VRENSRHCFVADLAVKPRLVSVESANTRWLHPQGVPAMTYVKPPELAASLIDIGESKVHMSTRDTLIRAYMGGALLTLAAAFAVKMAVDTGLPIVGAILFPIGFCLRYLHGYLLHTGEFVSGTLTRTPHRHDGTG